jgi:hypothetical protein
MLVYQRVTFDNLEQLPGQHPTLSRCPKTLRAHDEHPELDHLTRRVTCTKITKPSRGNFRNFGSGKKNPWCKYHG